MIAVHSWMLVSFCWKSQPYLQNSFSYERWWAWWVPGALVYMGVRNSIWGIFSVGHVHISMTK
jgi:hypothetical protein